MISKRTLAVTAAAVAAPLTLAGPAFAAGIKFTAPVTGTTYLAKPDVTAALPAGTYTYGEINGDTITSNMVVPVTTSRVRLLDIPQYGDATATVKIVDTRPAVTKLKLDGSADGTAYFKIQILAVYADALPGVNLVSPTCASGEIVAPTHSNKFELLAASTVTSTFTIPAFTGCGQKELGQFDSRDQLITDKLSGPGNTMNAVVGPAVLG